MASVGQIEVLADEKVVLVLQATTEKANVASQGVGSSTEPAYAHVAKIISKTVERTPRL